MCRHRIHLPYVAVLAVTAVLSLGLRESRAAVEFVADVQLPNCMAAGVALTGSHLLTTGSEETKSLWILDVSDDTRPNVVSTWGPYYGYPRDVAVQGSYAYVCDGGSLLVFDISTPASPTLVATMPAKPVDWPEGRDVPRAHQAILQGTYAYLASGGAGLSVVDVTDPLNPTILGIADVPGDTWQIAVAGDHAYLAARTGGLQIVSFADPSNPRRVAEHRFALAPHTKEYWRTGSVTGIAVSGSTALALSLGRQWGREVLITSLDVSDPANPVVVGEKEIPGEFGQGYYDNRLAQVSGTSAFVIARDTLTTLDISDPLDISIVSTFSLPESSTTLYAEGVGGEWVPRTIDIERRHPWFSSFHYDSGAHMGYLIDHLWGLWALDMSDLAHPRLVGAIPTAGEARVIRVFGERAYLTDWNGGLFAFDISDPANPQLIGQYYGFSMHDFHGDGSGMLYVPAACPNWPPAVGNEGRIAVVDVSSAPPREVASITPPVFGAVDLYDGVGASVYWFADRLYVTHRGELFVYEAGQEGGSLLGRVSVVPAMQDAGYECVPTPVLVRQVGPLALAYVASNSLGLSIVDVTDGAAPSIIGSLNTSTDAITMVDVEGDYAYVPRFDIGVWVVDVSDPAVPSLVADFGAPGSPMGSDRPIWVDANGATAWVADYSSGVYEWDVSDPTNPTMVGDVIRHTSVNQYSVAASGGYLYRADVGALEVYRILP